ncbi:MAG: CbiX/SirB N-terminal domain-containing protein [Planctomycetaceae bacterium]|nr:CbiX/SirB N-terminal domain-containing protein [Planctomycetaceae bacterium]
MLLKNQFSNGTRLLMLCMAILVISISSAFAQSDKSQKPGLLILSHGAPVPSWHAAMTELTKKVEVLNAEKKVFHAVTSAMMEFAQPDAAAGIETLEAAGCDRIIVVPVFVCPTSHTHFDVPAVLGLYSSPSIRQTLEEENARIATPKVPITVTQTMSEGDILDWHVETETLALSQDPKDEAVLIVAHGDAGHAPMINKIFNRLLVRASGSSGLTAGKVVYCGVGQTYRQDVIPAIRELSEQKKRVLVVGVYLATSAKSLNDRSSAMPGGMREMPGGPRETSARNPLEGIDVRFSEKGVIDHPKMPQWVLQTASEVL